MFTSTSLSSVLRAFASSMEMPVIAILLVLIGISIVLIGSIVAEVFTEGARLKTNLPPLVDAIKARNIPLEKLINESGLLKRQKAALLELTTHKELNAEMREALAVRLIYQERTHYQHILMITEAIERLGPMFGLLGTLIPLGPGILALGQGDTLALSSSLLTAFDTTIAGLLAAAVAFVISGIRKNWYSNYMSILELVMECVLEVENGEIEDEVVVCK